MKRSSEARQLRIVARRAALLLVVAGLGGADTTIAQQGPLQGRVRILSHNVFGDNECDCETRADAFGNRVTMAQPKYDIVGVQEYTDVEFPGVDCDASVLSEAMWRAPMGRYRPPAGDYDRFNPDGEIVDCEWDGGLGIFVADGSIIDRAEYEVPQHRPSCLGRVHGYFFARVALTDPPVTLDVYVVHLLAASDQYCSDPDACCCIGGPSCDQDCRREELVKLREKIIEHSACSGNPVIVMGDFNIGGPPTYYGNEGYEDIMSILGDPSGDPSRRPRDLWWETHPEYPPHPLFGYTVNCNYNTTLQCGNPGCDYVRRVDYIFVITDPTLTSNPYEVEIADPSDVETVVWSVWVPTELHVSDHFGVEASLDIRGLPAVWVDFADTGSDETGTPCKPFNTLADAITAVPEGNRVLIRAGATIETPRIDKALTLDALGGVVTIGR